MPHGARPAPGPLTQEIAAILRERRARLRIPQSAVAADAHMSTSQLSAFLNGQKHIDIEQVEAICNSLGLEWLDVLKQAEAASTRRILDERASKKAEQ